MRCRAGMNVVNRALTLTLFVFLCSAVIASAQRSPQSPYAAPNLLRSGVFAPSNPLGLPGTTGGESQAADSVVITPQLFKDI